jgi:hypothetical protein
MRGGETAESSMLKAESACERGRGCVLVEWVERGKSVVRYRLSVRASVRGGVDVFWEKGQNGQGGGRQAAPAMPENPE